MKLSNVLPLAALCSAIVLPSQQVLSELDIEEHHEHSDWLDSAEPTKEELILEIEKQFEEVTETGKQLWEHVSESTKNVVDAAFERAGNTANLVEESIGDFTQDLQTWVEDSDLLETLEGGHHGGHGKKPKHPHHHKLNQTIYQLIAGSKYTTTLAKLISEYDDLVEALNSTSANFTVFAPTDKAFAKIPEKAPKPSKEQLKAILSYHVVPDVYTAGRVLVSHTAPTLLKVPHLSSKPEPQRIAFKLGLRGLTINFYSRVIAINIPATNGVIHGVDSIIIPPPSTIALVDLFPGEFSSLELGLVKTGLLEKLNTTDHAGGTFFAPNNWAFQKLGPKVNAFLFSKYGEKYLKALLEYHVVPDNTLYSDAYYKSESEEVMDVPKGLFHVELPTLLTDRKLSVDVGRFGGFISIKINGFASVSVQDGIAEDGVIHMVSSVLIPPKKLGGSHVEYWTGEELTVEDVKERLEPFVAKTDL